MRAGNHNMDFQLFLFCHTISNCFREVWSDTVYSDKVISVIIYMIVIPYILISMVYDTKIKLKTIIQKIFKDRGKYEERL